MRVRSRSPFSSALNPLRPDRGACARSDISVLLGDGRGALPGDHVALVFREVFREPELLRDLRAGRRFLRLGAAEGGDTSYVEGSLMKLRRCAGYLRACHGQQGIPVTASTGGPGRGMDVCGGCVNQPGRRKQRVGVSD